MVAWLKGAAKAVVAGIAAGGAALAVVLGADSAVVAAVAVVLGPLLVYITPNAKV